MKELEFEIEISRPGDFGAFTSASLALPATWTEMRDAMDKARITDDRVIYSSELCDVRREYLRPHIGESAGLYDLNHLARRLSGLDDEQSKRLEALVRIEEARSGNEPIPLPRLINLTHSTGRCMVMPGVGSDEALGRFLHENNMLPEPDSNMANLQNWEKRYAGAFFGLLGEKRRETENGVFTDIGYVESGGIDEVYTPGHTMCFPQSGAPVVLELSKGCFNNPGYDNDLTVSLDLPANEDRIGAALEQVKAASLKEIGYSCADCLVPAAREWIDGAEDLGVVNEFAKALAYLEGRNMVRPYKALLEATKCNDLYTAAGLAYDADAYTLHSEMACPDDYAADYLSRLTSGGDGIDLAEFMNLYRLGVRVMERENAVDTAYGVLRRYDGGPVLSPEQDAPGPAMRL